MDAGLSDIIIAGIIGGFIGLLIGGALVVLVIDPLFRRWVEKERKKYGDK